MKICCDCKKEKELSCFTRNSRAKDGLQYRCRECTSSLHQKIKHRHQDRRKQHYQENAERLRQEKREYGKLHKSEKASYDRVYRQANKEKIAQLKKDWEFNNRDNTAFKIKRNLRRRVCHVIQNGYKSDHTMNLLGCTIDFFLKYLESKFKEGMTWENYGQYGWHIDHIIPCDSFDLTIPEEQQRCFHYTNLQPLWWQENLTKGYRVNNNKYHP